MDKAQVAALLERTREAASKGQYELYKTADRFDSTAKNPQWLGQHFNLRLGIFILNLPEKALPPRLPDSCLVKLPVSYGCYKITGITVRSNSIQNRKFVMR